MVFLGDRKYACETCIKGHRSSTCKHTDRPLFEIKKKGRPVTQCEHCRELRKTRQVHVKCVCEQNNEGEGLSSKGGNKQPVTAAFPAGLPQAMEASVTVQLLSEGSDSEWGSGGLSQNECACKTGESCNCCTPRVPASGSRRIAKRRTFSNSNNAGNSNNPQTDSDTSAPVSHPAGLVVLANGSGHRPVLPRPSPQRPASPPATPAHRASPIIHNSRHQAHAQNLYSPYGRAYEYTHGLEAMHNAEQGSSYRPTPMSAMSVNVPSSTPMSRNTFDRSDAASWGDLFSGSGLSPTGFENPTLNLCSCGPNCSCPGCIIHRGPTSDSSTAFDTCNNPGACFACANCNLFNLPPISPNERSPQVEIPENMDEWLRQMSTIVDPATGNALDLNQSYTPSSPSFTSPSSANTQNSPNTIPFNPTLWQSYALWTSLQNQTSNAHPAPEECCGGRCKCPAGMCTCAADCCGCCQGCQCPDCHHELEGNYNGERNVTFAVSGERSPCCGGAHGRGPGASGASASSKSFGGNMSMSMSMTASSQTQSTSFCEQWRDPSLTTHRGTVSRASSTSSRGSSGSSQHSHSSHGPSASPGSNSHSPTDSTALGSCCSGIQTMRTSPSSRPNPTPASASFANTIYRSSPSNSSNVSGASGHFRTMNENMYLP